MGDIIKLNETYEIEPVNENSELIDITQELLSDSQRSQYFRKSMSVPVAQLSTLGAGVSSLIPALNTVKQTTTIATDGLYKLANATVGDTLKVAKNGNFWGAFKTAEGKSKFAQLQAADPLTATTKMSAINPATMMMAVALFSVEREIGKIEEMQKNILTFLEIEKESEIQADVESLMGIIRKYKDNWDNERFIDGNHNQVLIYQNRARKNMLAYQKKIEEQVKKKQIIVAQANVNQAFSDLEKMFKYYRLSLYIFTLSSFMEIMLSGNFKESYISGIKEEIEGMTRTYRHLFEKCSHHLEKLGGSAVEANVLKSVGTVEKAVGKFIGTIPLVKRGPVDEFLSDSGSHLKKNAIGMEKKAVHRFASLGNPGTRMLMNKMDDMIQIYNHTEQICFDDKKIYLIAN